MLSRQAECFRWMRSTPLPFRCIVPSRPHAIRNIRRRTLFRTSDASFRSFASSLKTPRIEAAAALPSNMRSDTSPRRGAHPSLPFALHVAIAEVGHPVASPPIACFLKSCTASALLRTPRCPQCNTWRDRTADAFEPSDAFCAYAAERGKSRGTPIPRYRCEST